MKVHHRQSLAERVKMCRCQRGLSQAELAEMAGISTKTVQRLETGKAVAGSSRRAVLAALALDEDEVADAHESRVILEASPWSEVADAKRLLQDLVVASRVDVELDREGWRRARQALPWYRQKVILATHDPIEKILEVVDRADEISELGAGRAALEADILAALMIAANVMGWALAQRVDLSGGMQLYVGSAVEAARRVAEQGSQPP